MLTETNIASRGGIGQRVPGAFPHVQGEVRLESVTGPRVAVTRAWVTGAMAAGATFSAVAPIAGARKRVNPAWGPGQTPVSPVAHARKHDIYMTRVTANGGDAMGPHRRRVPV